MAQLPFLVVHGDVVGELLVAAGGVLGVVGAWLVRRVRERRRLMRERAALARDVGALSAGRATIAGRLRGRAATAVSESGKVVRSRGSDLTLEVDGEIVELRGEVEVLSGTRTASSWRRLPRGFASERVDRGHANDGDERGAWRAYELRDGDDVIACGMLATEAGMPREASGAASSDSDPTELATVRDAYREAAAVWVLSPVTEVPVVQLWAVRPGVRAEPYHPRRLALVWFLWAAAAFAGLWTAGDWLVRHHRLELAAATPHARDAALAELALEYDVNAPRTDETLQVREELADVRERCGSRAFLELHEQRYESAVATARRCDQFGIEIDALAHLGRYAEASQLLGLAHDDSPTRNAMIDIANGHWDAAAGAADAMAAATPRSRARFRCLAAWFRVKAGDPFSAPGMQSDESTTCTIVRALQVPIDQRGSFLAMAARMQRPTESAALALAGDLAWVYGAGQPPGAPDLFNAMSLLTGGTPHDQRIWLSQLALDHATQDPVDRVERYGEVAALDVIRGNLPAALSRVLSARQAQGERTSLEVEGLRQAIVLHAPDPIGTDPDLAARHPMTAPLVQLRSGTLSARLEVAPYERDGAMHRAFRASLGGDAGPLARELEIHRRLWEADTGAVLAVAPRLHDHLDQLHEALRNFHDDQASDLAGMPFGFLEEAAMHRDLAALTGDTEAAARWQKLIEAQLPILDDPDKVIALLLWQAN